MIESCQTCSINNLWCGMLDGDEILDTDEKKIQSAKSLYPEFFSKDDSESKQLKMAENALYCLGCACNEDFDICNRGSNGICDSYESNEEK